MKSWVFAYDVKNSMHYICSVMCHVCFGWRTGISDTHYQAADLEMVDAEYSELDNIPEMVVLLTAAVRGARHGK